MDERLNAAETHIAHLSRTVEDMSDQLARQADQLDHLSKRLEGLITYLARTRAEDTQDPPHNDRPPHY